MELDFSKLDKIAYRGFATEESKQMKDELVEQGFTIVEDATTPFEAPPPLQANETTGAEQSHSERKLKPFTGIVQSRNYRAMYRAACNYHEKYTPPVVGEDNGLTYWAAAAEEIGTISKAFNNDPFMIDLLSAVYSELEREYKLLRDGG